jgi:hypothetical protein
MVASPNSTEVTNEAVAIFMGMARQSIRHLANRALRTATFNEFIMDTR